jgi:hypothetical protein
MQCGRGYSGSADDLVGLEEERRGDRQAEGLSGREVDDQIKPHDLIDGQVARLGPLQDFVHIGGAPVR